MKFSPDSSATAFATQFTDGGGLLSHRFVANEDSPHYHASDCPYAKLIPEPQKAGFYAKSDAKKRGKIPCMNCL